MKVAIIGDTHFGIKDGSYNIFSFQKHFFTDVLFPKMNEIDSVIFLGDIFHNRKNINLRILTEVQWLFKKLKSFKKPVYSILGNHDFYFRNNYDVSAVRDSGLQIDFGEKDKKYFIVNENMLLMHWHNSKEELMETLNFINDNEQIEKVEYIFGHFALQGFNMVGSRVDNNENDAKPDEISSFFPNLKKIYSGHFHTPSKRGNVEYVGVPYQQTWADLNYGMGFHILETENGDDRFFLNPFRYFYSFKVDENFILEKEIENIKELDYRCIYKIVYSGEEFEETAKKLNDFIAEKNHDVSMIDESIYEKNIETNMELSNVSNLDELILKFFETSDMIPDGKNKFYYDYFKTFYDDNSIENNEFD